MPDNGPVDRNHRIAGRQPNLQISFSEFKRKYQYHYLKIQAETKERISN